MCIRIMLIALGISGSLWAQSVWDNYQDATALDPIWLEEDVPYTTTPEVPAVILQDLGWVFFESHGRTPKILYQYQRRIKILTEEGLGLADQEIRINRLNGRESLSECTAVTYALNPEGGVSELPIDKKDIQLTKEGDEWVYRFRCPFVRVGSVIQINYQVRSDRFLQLRPWEFQQTMPVLFSSITTNIPSTYRYLVIPGGDVSGLQKLIGTFRQQSSTPWYPLQSGLQSGASRMGSRDYILYRDLQGKTETYILRDLPAIELGEVFAPEETKAFVSSLQWELVQDELRRAANENLFDSWAQLDKVVYRRFRTRKLDRKYREELQAKVASLGKEGQVEKVESIYYWFRHSFEWDSTFAYEPGNLNKAMSSRQGNSAELNALLLMALRMAGVESWPVLIATREHGTVKGLYPLASQFNHVLVAILRDGEEFLMDVAGGVDKAGVLPRRDLNGQGFLLNGEGGAWMPLQSYQRVNQSTYSRMTISEEGKLTGEVSVVSQNFSSNLEAERLDEVQEDPLEYFRRFVWPQAAVNTFSNGSVKKEQIRRTDLLTVSCEVTTNDYVVKSGDLLFVRPMLMKTLQVNPFAAEKRTTPVDLSYPVWEAHMLGLRIPEGYDLVQVPQSIRVVMPGNAGQFTFHVMDDQSNILHITSTIQINRTRYTAEEYQAIREFFNFIVSKHQEDIVIKKRS